MTVQIILFILDSELQKLRVDLASSNSTLEQKEEQLKQNEEQLKQKDKQLKQNSKTTSATKSSGGVSK